MPVLTKPQHRLTEDFSTLSGLAAGMPSFPEAARPAPESPARKRLIHVVSVSAVIATVAYLAWRVVYTIDLSFWWVAVPLLALEVHNALGLGLFTFALWDMDAGPRLSPREATDWRVAVLIPTYDEPEEVLLPTIAAAVALAPAHETWVLDDGHRPEVERLARDLDARYLSRETNEHAKAGNLNHALETIDADLIAVLDADHIARRDLLRNTLGYFDDPDVAIVQTPQDFYNLDSFEHQSRGSHRLFNEQAVFYRVIAAAKNRWAAAFWCGTSGIIRVEALRSVGGVATGTVTEDIQTTIRLHKRGWKTVYHNEVLARGLAARTATEYMLQRQRWATGAMQVLRSERPLTGRGLTFGQRVGYATTLWGWFDAWRSLGYIVLPVVVIATGAVPINAPLAVFGPLFLSALAIQFVALRLLARGHYPPFLSIVFEFLRMPAVLSGTLTLLHNRVRPFKVTPKGASRDTRSRTAVPPLTIVLLVVSVAAVIWFVLTAAGLTPFHYPEPGVVFGACAFLVGNAFLLSCAARRVREPRFAPERRSGVRLRVVLRGTVDTASCTVQDLSMAGARVITAAAPADADDEVVFAVHLPDETLTLRAAIARRAPAPSGQVDLGLLFAPEQRTELAQLAVALLTTDGTSEHQKRRRPANSLRKRSRTREPEALQVR